MSFSNWIPVPNLFKYYEHQIAGHGVTEYQSKEGLFLRIGDDTVLKPLQKFPRGLVELTFYQTVFSPQCQDPLLLNVRPFLPEFKGLYFDQKTDQYYIGLENILAGLSNPSVMDCKMGQKTYVPTATEEKRLSEIQKYAHREETGFLIAGIKLFDPLTHETRFFDRFYGRKLSVEQIYTDGILTFLGPEPNRARRLAQSAVEQLRCLLTWFESQRRFAFFASSLLLAYGTPGTDTMVVKWIDFANTLDAGSESQPSSTERTVQLDENFMFGLRKLTAYFERAASLVPSPVVSLDSSSSATSSPVLTNGSSSPQYAMTRSLH